MGENLDMIRMNRAIYEAKHREKLERDHFGEIVLMHDGQIIGIYGDLGKAYDEGVSQFGEERFSLIEIGWVPDLGSLHHLIS